MVDDGEPKPHEAKETSSKRSSKDGGQEIPLRIGESTRDEGGSKDAKSAAPMTYANVAAVTTPGLRARAEAFLTRRTPLEVENTKLQSEKQAEKKNKDLSSHVKALEEKVEIHKESKIRYRDERNRAQERIQELQDLVEELTSENDTVRTQMRGLNRKCEEDQDIIRRLQEQVTYYKVNISEATRPVGSVADDVIKEKVDGLFRSIQGFVVRNFKGARFDFNQLPHEWKAWTTGYIPRANNSPKNHCFNICVSLISSLLCQMSEAVYYFGGLETQPLLALVEVVRQLRPECRSKTKPWLEASRELVSANDPDMLRASDENLRQTLAFTMERTIVRAMQVVEWTETKHHELVKVIGTAIELFRLLLQQQALFEFKMLPALSLGGHPEFVKPDTMQDVEGMEEDEALLDRTIAISVFPAVFKFGDERGENLHLFTVVSKARVVLEDASP